MIEPLDEITARKTVRDYLCSTCWGHLYLADFAPERKYVVWCNQCGEDTKGFVKKSSVEHIKDEQTADRKDFEDFYGWMLPESDDEETQEADEIIKSLGF